MSLRMAATLSRRALSGACSSAPPPVCPPCAPPPRPPCRAQPPTRALSGACSSAPPPACPPCAPPPRPPCRAQPPTRARAIRKVCCPPAPGHAPPCDPKPCVPTLSCANHLKTPKKCPVPIATVGCGAERDGVALRLALAERTRRLDYEREVKTRATQVAAAVPPAPYAPGVERECARATDGREYALLAPCERGPPPRCGPDRAPPPDRCVELAVDAKCTVRPDARVDPCAHVPKTLVEIDRSATPPKAPARNLTSRIMQSLNLSRNTKTSCPRRTDDTKCETSGAKRAGDSGWCKTLQPPKRAPVKCREPTPMEKLKRRAPSRCSDNGASGKRALHSSAILISNAPGVGKKTKTSEVSGTKSDTNAIKRVLKERENLKEAGRGRFVTGKEIHGKSPRVSTAGSLDIPVPLGAESVRVRVSLESASGREANTRPDARDAPLRNCGKPTSDKQDSWLSIKSLVAACRKSDGSKAPKEAKKSDTSSPCPPAATPASPCGCPTIPKKPPHPLPSLKPCKQQKPFVDPCKPKKSTPPSDPCQSKKPSRFLIYT